MTGMFLKLWVSISEAGVKMGQEALREIIHINPESAQGTGQQLSLGQGARMAAAHGEWRNISLSLSLCGE